MNAYRTSMSGPSFLSNGGAYAIIAAVWILSSILYVHYANRLGHRYDSPNDGCLLAFAVQVLVIIGGSIGLLSSPYPAYLFTSSLGAILFPALACVFFNYRMRAWKTMLKKRKPRDP